MVVDGINGFHAHAPQEWFARLSQLISSPELRNRMGKNGREMVVKEYSLKALWPKFLMTISNVTECEYMKKSEENFLKIKQEGISWKINPQGPSGFKIEDILSYLGNDNLSEDLLLKKTNTRLIVKSKLGDTGISFNYKDI